MRELICVLKEGLAVGWYDWFILIVSVVVAFFEVMIVVWNTNKQIDNQNRETYKPRLKLKALGAVKKETGKRYLYACSNNYDNNKENVSLYVDIELENIGNGIANDLSFYMLANGKKCLGLQVEDNNMNQELNSTIEIPKGNSQKVKFLFNINIDKINEKETVLLICNYKDLNNNNYKMLIGVILNKYEPFTIEYSKKRNLEEVYNAAKFSIYYYQEETEAYKAMVENEMYKNYYKEILKAIK